MDTQRKTKLEIAAVLLRSHLFRPDGGMRVTTWHPEGIDLEEMLSDKVAEAERDLRDFRESRAFRMALDQVLPGWFDIDYSEFVTEDVDFVSDDPVEWYDFLIDRGVPAEEAEMLLARAGHPVDEGASRRRV